MTTTTEQKIYDWDREPFYCLADGEQLSGPFGQGHPVTRYLTASNDMQAWPVLYTITADGLMESVSFTTRGEEVTDLRWRLVTDKRVMRAFAELLESV